MANRPPRLERLFEEYSFPLWYLTFNTRQRARLLAKAEVQQSFEAFCRKAMDREIYVGRYVLMPDHAHLFVAGVFDLSAWVRILKLTLSESITGSKPHWQEGAFDHLYTKQRELCGEVGICASEPCGCRLGGDARGVVVSGRAERAAVRLSGAGWKRALSVCNAQEIGGGTLARLGSEESRALHRGRKLA